MKKIIVIIAACFAAAVFISASQKDSKMLRHVVLFKFKDSATPEQVKQVENAFLALPSAIKEIKDFEWGTNNSPENLNEGLTHCFFLSFNSEKDRDVYLPHPAHKAFGAILKPYLDKVIVVDYWVKN
ncbi:MAG: Dabb family protein [Chitinophagaceae bacterium]